MVPILISPLMKLFISFSYSLYSLIIALGLIFSIFSFLIKPNSFNCFLNSLSGILSSFMIIFLSSSISFKYLPKYNNLISYLLYLPKFFSLISLIAKDEKGKNNTSFSYSLNDIFSISP